VSSSCCEKEGDAGTRIVGNRFALVAGRLERSHELDEFTSCRLEKLRAWPEGGNSDGPDLSLLSGSIDCEKIDSWLESYRTEASMRFSTCWEVVLCLTTCVKPMIDILVSFRSLPMKLSVLTGWLVSMMIFSRSGCTHRFLE
jgi:hypothetical protein